MTIIKKNKSFLLGTYVLRAHYKEVCGTSTVNQTIWHAQIIFVSFWGYVNNSCVRDKNENFQKKKMLVLHNVF